MGGVGEADGHGPCRHASVGVNLEVALMVMACLSYKRTIMVRSDTKIAHFDCDFKHVRKYTLWFRNTSEANLVEPGILKNIYSK